MRHELIEGTTLMRVMADIPPELAGDAGPVNLCVPSVLHMEIDLRARNWVNLDFRNVAQDRIPLHLSLRRDACQIVANRWSPKGWRREVALAAKLRKSVHQVRLELSQALHGGVEAVLWLDGTCIGRLDALPRRCKGGRFGLRRGFPDLGDLGAMTWPDGLLSLRRFTPTPASALMLTPHLELALALPVATAGLDLGNGEPCRPFLPSCTGAAQGPQLALVPGRIWRDCAAGEIVLIARSDTGAELARMVLRQVDMLAMLQRADVQWLLRHDTLARLQWLEHVHFAGLWQRVPGEVRDILSQEAARNPAAGFAPQRTVTVSAPQVPCAPVTAACDAFHRSRRDLQPANPVAQFQTLALTGRLNVPEARHLALLLSEWFCLSADPRDLCRAAHDLGVTDWGGTNDPWARIAALPMLWAEGEWQRLLASLKKLPIDKPNWVVTPALAWIARAIADDLASLDGTRPEMGLRAALAQALLELVAAFAPSYMSQMGCKALIAAILDLLDAAADFPDWCQPYFAQLALQAYGLNRDFWNHPPARLPKALHPWQLAFQALHAACLAGDWPRIHRLARPYLAQSIAGGEVLSRLSLSAQALPTGPDGLPDLSALTGISAPARIDEAALRWLAFPRSASIRDALPLDTDAPVHRAACAGLQAAATDVPRQPHARAQQQLGALVQTLLADLCANRQIEPDTLAQVIRMAQTLARAEAGFLGLAALLALAEALVRAGAKAQAAECVSACIAALGDIAPEGLSAAPALAAAIARFDSLCPDRALRDRLRTVLPVEPRLLPPGTEDRRLAALRRRSNPFADTFVALISCHANLGTRAQDIRAAWGKTLADWGIPLVTVVGRAAGQRPGAGHVFDGQVLHLDVPDDYEGLPQKTLALTEWVLHRSGFGRVFKIDDDCFLDVEAFFSDPAFLTVHYFGRPLRRGPGDMDRAWHMLRATGLRGRYELDKSPEPSRYADGGSGYVLNRTALLALQDMRATVRGRALEQVSFMEDKLVGDLLSAAGIDVAGPGYDLAIFRKAAPSLPAIPQFSDGFLPFKGARTKLAHLDGGISAQSVAQARQSPWPMPMKVWPLQRAAGLGWAKHGLTLVSPAEQLERAEAADCAVVAVMRDEAFMVEHFLTHYRRLGVGGFLIVDNGSRDGTLEYLARQPDVALFTTDTPYRDSAYGVIWQEALLAQFRLGKWSLVADADELLFWSLPDAAGRVRGSLPDLLRQPEFATADAARIFMFDLYPKGRLADAQFTRAPFVEASHLDREPLCRDWQGRGPWSNAETCTSALRHRVMREAGVQVRANLFVAQKYALLRYHPFMQLSTGLHYIAGAQIAARDLAFGHFKYHAQFHAKALREAARAQHFNNAEEYRTYLSLQAEGRDTLYQPGTSVPLAQSRAVRDICGLPETDPFASLRSGRAPVTPRTRRPLRYTLALPQQGQGAHVIRAG